MSVIPNRLLLGVAFFVGIPSAFLLVYDQGVIRLIVGVILFAVLGVIGIDCFFSRRRLNEVSCQVPELIRGTVGREIEIPIRLLNRGKSLNHLRCGIPVIRHFHINDEAEKHLGSLAAGKQQGCVSHQTPLKRGSYRFERIYLETPSRLKCWLIRRSVEVGTELRIYPDLTLERQRLASIFLMRGHDGAHLVRQVGKGRDFEQLREYQPGDEYADIDWKATARQQMPVTRMYQIEKTQEVYVVVDHSRMSGREIRVPLSEDEMADYQYALSTSGSSEMVITQLEKFLQCALILSSVAERQGDRFGFVSFAHQVGQFIRAGSGKGHYNVIRDSLYTLEPKSAAPDFESLMIALRQKLTKRSLIVMLVDLSDPLTAEQFLEVLPIINRKHLVLVNMVRPPRAQELFSGKQRPETSDDIYEALGGHLQWSDLSELRTQLRHLGVELGMPDHEELCTETVTQYLNVKNRQLI